jgi:hypothetical protein
VKLEEPQIPATMREPAHKPLVDLPDNWTREDDGVMTFQAADMPLYQPVIYATRAWELAYLGRRQAVESANAGLKHAGRNIGQRGHCKVFTRAKIGFPLIFEAVAYNLRRIDAWDRAERHRSSQAENASVEPRRRARRSTGTDTDIQQATELRSTGAQRTTDPP